MNYRHAFHAGNFADVLKHLVLTRVLVHLGAKPKPFRAIDTHAGLGWYDLGADEAGRTGEWRDGWGRLDAPFPEAVEALLAPYRAAVAATKGRRGPDAYPGSPEIIREFLRPSDQGVFVELHPADADTLRLRYAGDALARVMPGDGWGALNALIPPPERRGLVLIDPPYEERGEVARLGQALAAAAAKWPTGVYLGWYPIKGAAAVDRMVAELERTLKRPALRLDLLVAASDETRLTGSGLVVVNPPWRLAEEAALFLPALAGRLGRSDGGGFRCEPFGAPA